MVIHLCLWKYLLEWLLEVVEEVSGMEKSVPSEGWNSIVLVGKQYSLGDYGLSRPDGRVTCVIDGQCSPWLDIL